MVHSESYFGGTGGRGLSPFQQDWLSWLQEHDDSVPAELTSLNAAEVEPPTPVHLASLCADNHIESSENTAISPAGNILSSNLRLSEDKLWESNLPTNTCYSPGGFSTRQRDSFDLSPGLPQESDKFYYNDVLYNSESAFSADCGAPSNSSVGSIDSSASTSATASLRRRRRKRATRSSEGAKNRRYQCTFCTDAFKTKHDWQRHETSMHLSLEQWKCTRFGPVLELPDGRFCCVFCEQFDPPASHTELHNYSACMAQPDAARIFHRKDHLRQHLRLFHRGCTFQETMSKWLASIDEVKSRCGFCDARLDTWPDRQKHLAIHFRDGADMKDWKGDRGLDPQINDMVENDMPVFMIGDQRQTMEPFSASRADHRLESCIQRTQGTFSSNEPSPGEGTLVHSLETPQGTHSYRYTERLLLKYVSQEIAQGRVPTDSQLQKKSSEIMYGPDNAWDQTWADNPQWLEMFRKKAGLISLPLSDGRNAFVGFDVM